MRACVWCVPRARSRLSSGRHVSGIRKVVTWGRALVNVGTSVRPGTEYMAVSTDDNMTTATVTRAGVTTLTAVQRVWLTLGQTAFVNELTTSLSGLSVG